MKPHARERSIESIASRLASEAVGMFVPPFPFTVEVLSDPCAWNFERNDPAAVATEVGWFIQFHTAKGTATVSGRFSADALASIQDDDALEPIIRAAIADGMERCPDSRDRAAEFRQGGSRARAFPQT